MPLALVLLADGFLEVLLGFLRREIAFHGRQHRSGLLAAHDRDARVRPHPEKARRIRAAAHPVVARAERAADRKSTRLNSSHGYISYAVFCLKKKKKQNQQLTNY